MSNSASNSSVLPSGTVTFMFTDIEGSTQLIQQLQDEYATLLTDQRNILRAAFEKWSGHEVDTQGDSFFVAFKRASDAANASVDIQRALAEYRGPQGVTLRVRMGLHTAESHKGPTGYVGIDVHRAARICSAGHGGQVLLSQTTYDLIEGNLPRGVGRQDLGEHRLKDLNQPQRLYHLEISGLPIEFPPLKTLDVLPNNLPLQLTSYIGREREMAEIKELFFKTRLLTLTGVGGSGKTRLAEQVATDLLENFADGVWLAELAPLTEPTFVVPAVSSALGYREASGRPILDVLTDYLRPKKLLLLLDNCEHLIASCAELADRLLRACSHVQILATSREPLGTPGETIYSVPSLSLPDVHHLPPFELISEYEALQLFVERAMSVSPKFMLTKDNVNAVSQICYHLDGIPLALELAAARVRALSIEQIMTRLHDRFSLLTAGSRTALPHHQTLRALIDWSYGLLSGKECVLLRRLSVFTGDWSIDAAERICSGGEIEFNEVLDLLIQLVDKSLVAPEEGPVETRYRMLETIREYATEKLVEKGEIDAISHQHADFFLVLAEQAEPKLTTADRVLWLNRLEVEYDNIREALQWFIRHEKAEEGARLGGALWRFWEVRGHWTEGRNLLAAVFEIAEKSGSSPAQAKVLQGTGVLAFYQRDYAEAKNSFEQSLSLYREFEDYREAAWILIYQGWMANDSGNFELALALLNESLTLFRKVGDQPGIAWSLCRLGLVAYFQGDYNAARPLIEESLALSREVCDPLETGFSLFMLYSIELVQGDLSSARVLGEESEKIHRTLRNRRNLAYSLQPLAFIEGLEGNVAKARSLLKESLKYFTELGDHWACMTTLACFAILAGGTMQSERAVRLGGAVATLHKKIGGAIPDSLQISMESTLESARSALGAKAESEGEQGCSMTMEQAIEYALEELIDG
ncbi:MAG: adenylate/guanylate cyclase domain-containing protein [bacterium]|nr:adenylate/guanylate cyclase domain-containing protein [bacterium]